MTFSRAAIIALMTAALVYILMRADSDEGSTAIGLVLFVAYGCWQLTSDPLPAAIERGLEDFVRRHRR